MLARLAEAVKTLQMRKSMIGWDLEDLEALHRSLKELESVKGYVQVVERAMQLRCVAGVFPGHAQTELPSGWYGVVVRLLLSRRARRAW